MTTTEFPAATRTTARPVRIETATGQIVLFVGSRAVASAWGPVVGDHATWVYWNGRTVPYRISGGPDGALALIEHERDEWARREGSIWHPDHGQPDQNGHIGIAPVGVCCAGCGQDMGGDTFASVVAYRTDDEVTWNYVCPTCECYLDNED